MTEPCKDCACAMLHDYEPHSCKLSNGKPCQECFQLGLLDSQISQVHSQLVQLAQKRHTLKTKRNQRHEPFIHRLPRAVSSEIFIYYVHHVSGTFNPKNASNSVYTRDWSPAFFLSSICATWRKIALTTPEIWRFINIPLLEYKPDVDLKIELLKECVDRAAHRSLFIGVFQFQLDDQPRFSQLEEKLDTLIPLFDAIKGIVSRSEEITVWGLPSGALELLLPQDAPNLRAVRIAEAFGYFEDGDGPVGWNEGHISLESPSLRTLDFGFTSTLLTDMEIVWDSITTVRMADISAADAVDVLRQAPCLTSCSFTLDGMNSSCRNVEFPKVPVVNSALKKMHVEFDHRCKGVENAFVNNVTLPSLQELSLRVLTQLPIREFKSCFERSRCRVRTLTLVLLECTPADDIIKLLKMVSSVEDFILEAPLFPVKSTVTNKLFETLRHSRSASSGKSANPVLPKLRSLSYTGPMDFTWNAFLEMFPLPELLNVDHGAAARPLCQVSLKLRKPKDFAGILPKLYQIQQNKIQLMVADLEGNDLLKDQTLGNV